MASSLFGASSLLRPTRQEKTSPCISLSLSLPHPSPAQTTFFPLFRRAVPVASSRRPPAKCVVAAAARAAPRKLSQSVSQFQSRRKAVFFLLSAGNAIALRPFPRLRRLLPARQQRGDRRRAKQDGTFASSHRRIPANKVGLLSRAKQPAGGSSPAFASWLPPLGNKRASEPTGMKPPPPSTRPVVGPQSRVSSQHRDRRRNHRPPPGKKEPDIVVAAPDTETKSSSSSLSRSVPFWNYSAVGCFELMSPSRTNRAVDKRPKYVKNNLNKQTRDKSSTP